MELRKSIAFGEEKIMTCIIYITLHWLYTPVKWFLISPRYHLPELRDRLGPVYDGISVSLQQAGQAGLSFHPDGIKIKTNSIGPRCAGSTLRFNRQGKQIPFSKEMPGERFIVLFIFFKDLAHLCI